MVLILQEKRSLQPRHAIVGPSGAVLDVVLWESKQIIPQIKIPLRESYEVDMHIVPLLSMQMILLIIDNFRFPNRNNQNDLKHN